MTGVTNVGLLTRLAEVEAENVVLRSQVELGITRLLGLTQELQAQGAAHERRRELMRQLAKSHARLLASVKVIAAKNEALTAANADLLAEQARRRRTRANAAPLDDRQHAWRRYWELKRADTKDQMGRVGDELGWSRAWVGKVVAEGKRDGWSPYYEDAS